MIINELAITKWCNNVFSLQLDLLKEIVSIPAPSNKEDKRAKFILNLLYSIGYTNAYIDEVKNVVVCINCDNSEDITLFSAHIDTVFQDENDISYEIKSNKIYAPGVGDNTANVVALILILKYIKENKIQIKKSFLFVFNAGEEGLGNLKGIKYIFNKYQGMIKRSISFDLGYSSIANKSVGSERFSIIVQTEGGHSFNNFGNRNAIAYLSSIICSLYTIKPPIYNNSKTTYNVGVIKGGTSVNTIAQEASILYEYRSDDKRCLNLMKKSLFKIIDAYDSMGINVKCDIIGERPCMSKVNKSELNKLIKLAENFILNETGTKPILKSLSTDANIPLSLGIPAISYGLYEGYGEHTREEWVSIPSLNTGLKIGLKQVLHFV